MGAAAASSATNSACSQSTATINSAADATALASCSTVTGDILIGTGASGIIAIDGPQQVTGDLICQDAGALTSLTSTSINSIGGNFTLQNLTLLSTLQFNALTEVGAISWITLPALPSLTMTQVISKAKSVSILNTFLSTLDGINLQTVESLVIANNNRLKTFSTQVANITSNLDIDSNGRLLDVSFPNLIWAAAMTFRNVSTVSIPSLASVNGTLGFYGNYFTSLNAPNLTTVGSLATGQGSLAFVANSQLGNITIPMLQSVGGAAQIANNSDLTAISFPKLSQVGGAIDFSGNFTTPELPDLSNVKGGFNMQSTNQIDCSSYQSQHSSGVIQGTFTCKTTADAQSSGTSSSGGSSTSSSGSSTTSKAAAVSYGVSDGLVGLSVVGGLLQMLL